MRQTSEQLRTETAQLVTALRAPQIRGRWGELQLERAVEAAGLTEHIDYVTQVTAPGEDGVVRPDLVVRLVGGKNVVVDSKVAFNAYLEAMDAHLTRNWAPLSAVVTRGQKLIELPVPELYDLAADPRETTNLFAREPARARTLGALLRALTASFGSRGSGAEKTTAGMFHGMRR